MRRSMHHPPIALDTPAQQALMLQNASALAESIEGSDVRVLLCGHHHRQLTGRLGHTPVVVTPGVINRIDLTTALRTERAVRGGHTTADALADQIHALRADRGVHRNRPGHRPCPPVTGARLGRLGLRRG